MDFWFAFRVSNKLNESVAVSNLVDQDIEATTLYFIILLPCQQKGPGGESSHAISAISSQNMGNLQNSTF